MAGSSETPERKGRTAARAKQKSPQLTAEAQSEAADVDAATAETHSAAASGAHLPAGHPRRVPEASGHVAHVTRGRMRLSLNTRDEGRLGAVKSELHQLPGVHRIEVHPRTGSVIVHHSNPNHEFARHLSKLIEDTGLLALKEAKDPSGAADQLTAIERDSVYLLDHSKSGKVLIRYAEHINRAVKHATDGWLDLRVLFPASVAVTALVFSSVETAPLWVPLALFSFQSFNNLHQPRPVMARVQPSNLENRTPSPEDASSATSGGWPDAEPA